MGGGSTLTSVEQGRILAYNDQGMKLSHIAKAVARSRTVVRNFLADPSKYNSKKRPGPKPKLTKRQVRLILREGAKGECYASEIVAANKLPVSKRRVCQILSSCKHLKFSKKKASPVLSDRHKTARIEWAEKHVLFSTSEWDRVIFSDEKKFNLDGPDGFKYYWHDLRKEEVVYSRRQSGGGSLMIWAGICTSGKTELAFLNGNQNASDYILTLSEVLLPFVDLTFGRDCIFQQDNAAIHSARITKEFFDEQNLTVMEWPSKSPDLNPIENVWGILARAVYAHGRQFANCNDLKTAVVAAWSEIVQDVVVRIIRSMPRRCIKTLKRGGLIIDY